MHGQHAAEVELIHGAGIRLRRLLGELEQLFAGRCPQVARGKCLFGIQRLPLAAGQQIFDRHPHGLCQLGGLGMALHAPGGFLDAAGVHVGHLAHDGLHVIRAVDAGEIDVSVHVADAHLAHGTIDIIRRGHGGGFHGLVDLDRNQRGLLHVPQRLEGFVAQLAILGLQHGAFLVGNRLQRPGATQRPGTQQHALGQQAHAGSLKGVLEAALDLAVVRR